MCMPEVPSFRRKERHTRQLGGIGCSTGALDVDAKFPAPTILTDCLLAHHERRWAAATNTDNLTGSYPTTVIRIGPHHHTVERGLERLEAVKYALKAHM